MERWNDGIGTNMGTMGKWNTQRCHCGAFQMPIGALSGRQSLQALQLCPNVSLDKKLFRGFPPKDFPMLKSALSTPLSPGTESGVKGGVRVPRKLSKLEREN
ncbi:hypothetical protein ACLKA6_015866 [Drosophila palustris]